MVVAPRVCSTAFKNPEPYPWTFQDCQETQGVSGLRLTSSNVRSWASNTHVLFASAPSDHRPLTGGLRSLDLPAQLLATPFSCECLLRTSLVTRLQVKGMLLDIFDNIFLLNPSLEPAEGALDRFTFLQSNFCQPLVTPSVGSRFPVAVLLWGPN